MNTEVIVLCATAASIGFLHTLFGPDHYVPFIAMSRARKWSITRTAWITFWCGVGHVFSSVILGLLGIALGIAVMKLEAFEAVRGSLAAWILISFGFAYFVWGIHMAIRNKPHKHLHIHDDATVHEHEHTHVTDHTHAHASASPNITPWILFTIFVFGPCEPLIPILMYPAAKSSVIGMVLVTLVFAVTTIGTMMAIVLSMAWGISFARFGRLERYMHATAGAMILLSGIAIQFLGL